MKRAMAMAALAALLSACAHRQPPPEMSSTMPAAKNVQAAGEPALPAQAKPVYENAQVRVSRLKIGQYQRVTLPDTPNVMMYSLQDCSLRLDSADGRSWDLATKKDQVIWSDAAQRGATATGDKSCDLVVIEVKHQGTAPAAAPAAPSTGVQTSP